MTGYQQILLRAAALSVNRGDRTLISGFDLNLHAGQVMHLRGRNGAGKTSLLEVLAGLRAPQAGDIEKSRLHWLGHANALHPQLSVVENLRFWCGLNGLAVASIPSALEQLGLARLRHRAARTLSAGQKRRAALARLLLSPRPLWLLDEPLSGLDVEGLERFSSLLAAHADNGGAALVTSHQPLPLPPERVTLRELDA